MADKDLYTIRQGEQVHDNISKSLKKTDCEIIKVRDKHPSSGCIYYDHQENACRIYPHRPAQCRTFACWNTEPFMKLYEGPKATRKDIFRHGVLLGIMEEHEKRFSYKGLEYLIGQIEKKGEKAVEDILNLLRFEAHFREFVREKLDIPESAMAFLFGRPLTETIIMFGLKVEKRGDREYFLTIDR
jgi:Fe-S-cluster containining protein